MFTSSFIPVISCVSSDIYSLIRCQNFITLTGLTTGASQPLILQSNEVCKDQLQAINNTNQMEEQ